MNITLQKAGTLLGTRCHSKPSSHRSYILRQLIACLSGAGHTDGPVLCRTLSGQRQAMPSYCQRLCNH